LLKNIGVGEHQVQALCKTGRRHEEEGMPKQKRITAAEFKKQLSGVPEDVAAPYRELFSKRKQQMLDSFPLRFSRFMLR
jgi:hypothetical protein